MGAKFSYCFAGLHKQGLVVLEVLEFARNHIKRFPASRSFSCAMLFLLSFLSLKFKVSFSIPFKRQNSIRRAVFTDKYVIPSDYIPEILFSRVLSFNIYASSACFISKFENVFNIF